MKKNLAIVLEFGFHEIKKYIHSGFAAELSKDFNITWLALNKNSADFDAYFKNTGFPLVYFEEAAFKKASLKIEQYNLAIRKNWIINQGLGTFHNHSKVKSRNWKTALIGNSLLKRVIEKQTLREVKNAYFNAPIANIYENHRIELLFTTGFASCFAKSTVITAQQLNISVHYLVNSWKDLFINNFLPFQGLKGLYVWSETMKHDYLKQIPYLKDEPIVISGNPTFDVLIDAMPTKERSFYAEKYQLSISAKWLLYTMMPVGLTTDEIETIRYTAEELLRVFPKEEIMILVRKNPTHETDDFLALDLPENVRIAEHFCSFDKVNDMIVQSPTGEQEWLDLLQHCEMNLSVPSTVSLEFMTLSKPVLNIAYNASGKQDERIIQFFEAGFYRLLFETKSVINIRNSNDLIDFLQKFETKIPEDTVEIKERASKIIIDQLISI